MNQNLSSPEHQSTTSCVRGLTVFAVGFALFALSCVSLSPTNNSAPDVPVLTGDTTAVVGDTCVFLAWATDLEGDVIAYSFDIDGVVTFPPFPLWTYYAPSGDTVGMWCVFSEPGAHSIYVRAKDSYENMSSTSVQLSIRVNPQGNGQPGAR